MKFAFLDSIAEEHVPRSLSRALRSRGHSVLRTPRLTHGHVLRDDPATQDRLSREVDAILAWRPDVVMCFRPASTPIGLLQRIRRHGVRAIAWFSDDPVFFKTAYGPVVDSYDLILHCGGVAVLDFYTHRFGRATGINFPFFTDAIELPRRPAGIDPDADLLFLGNSHDEVRSRRIEMLRSLPVTVRAFGKHPPHAGDLYVGRIDSLPELRAVAASFRAAVSIPQRFADYAGRLLWFDGLKELGTFQYPSRLVQYAALGMPILSLGDDADTSEFPELIRVQDADAVGEAVRQLRDDDTAAEISEQTHERFLRTFSAASRVQLLESALTDDSWRSKSTSERAAMFAQFDGREHREPPEPPVARYHRRPRMAARRPIAVLGDGWLDELSSTRRVVRALRASGADVLELNPFAHREVIRDDPAGHFRGQFDVTAWKAGHRTKPSLLIVVGEDYGITATGSLPVLYLGGWRQSVDALVMRNAEQASVSATQNPELVDRLARAGVANPVLVPVGLDTALAEKARNLRDNPGDAPLDGLVILARHENDVAPQQRALNGALGEPGTRVIVARGTSAFAQIAACHRPELTIVLPQPHGARLAPTVLHPLVLETGAVAATPRGPDSTPQHENIEGTICFGSITELREKHRWLSRSPAFPDLARRRSQDLLATYFDFEAALRAACARALEVGPQHHATHRKQRTRTR